MGIYRELARELAAPQREDAVFLCGARCTAEIDLGRQRIGRMSMSPLDVLTELDIQVEGEQDSTVRLFPNHIVKTHRLAPGVTARSTWFAAGDLPCFVVWWEVRNEGEQPYEFRLSPVAGRGWLFTACLFETLSTMSSSRPVMVARCCWTGSHCRER